MIDDSKNIVKMMTAGEVVISKAPANLDLISGCEFTLKSDQGGVAKSPCFFFQPPSLPEYV